ncbi:methyltransferase domain-containing protein [Trichoderma breve]|uniref:Methyltransferase domain-containing protein n=1 Tax=Trichoderma breve TaxID=2034170 RepID=A0A9W9B7W4_9HYPO|nr:methyltransferase domain-containing protein [Trichoderma breve]KAJ4858237.1 methyltransferase domain-containing protein [Trichoderma breve]
MAVHDGMGHGSSTQGMDNAWSNKNGNDTLEGGNPEMDASPSLPYSEDSAVAVTGMACKFAGAESLEQLWQILETGTTLYRDLPKDRFPDARFARRSYERPFKANTIDDVDAFDHKFFKVASREATFMDPQQRLGLQVTYQALESAGYFSRDTYTTGTERDIGCYFATCTNEYAENVATHPPSAFSLTGSIRPFIAGKISHHFGWTGPAIMYDTACAASGTAIHQACQAVATGDCNAAIAGATNIFVSPDTFQNLASGQFTSPTGASKSFDAAADGYCRGEGVAVVVLKKLSAAIRDGDPIMGVIAATGVNQNANEHSITVPHGPTQMNLYRKVLRRAGMHADDISYVEAHGTGTALGDPIESRSIRGVFGNHSRPHGDKTYLGSLKSNIGHTEATSGLSGLIKVILMMQKGMIPPQALLKNLNPAIGPMEPSGMAIATSKVPWNAQFKAACINNYGASGTNAAMIVAQPPNIKSRSSSTSVATYPVSITAFSPSSMSAYCSELLSFISQSDSASDDLALGIAYHLWRRRNPSLPFTACATVSSLQELKDFLSSTISREPLKNEIEQQPVVLYFGGQTGKMATVPRSFYDSSAIFRKRLDDCDATLRALGSPSIFPDIFEPGPHEDVVLLHSILFSAHFGQLTALCVSGVLSLHDGLQLITGRARLIQEHWGNDSGSMIAIEADLGTVKSLLAQHAHLGLDIACYNGPQSFVIAGSTSSVDALEAFLKSAPQPFQAKRLRVTNAFHSSLTEPLLQPLQDITEQLNFQSPKIPLETCSELGTWETATPALVTSHMRDPVYFHQAVERIAEQLGPCTWLEAGSGFGAAMVRRALGTQASANNIKSMSLESASSIEPLAEMTAQLWELARFWLEWKDLAPPAVEVPVPVSEPASLLQLLQKTSDGGEFRINTRCESWQTICSENYILDVQICSIASIMNLVSKAIDTIQNSPAQKNNVYNVEYLAQQSPIPAKSEDNLNLTVTRVKHSQSWNFIITSTANSSQTYVSGIVSAPSVSSERVKADFARFRRLIDTTLIKNLTNDDEADSVKGKAVYKSVLNVFQIPKSGQSVKEVSAKGNEAAGYLVSSFNNKYEAIEHFIQVPLLCLNGLQDIQENEVFVNMAMGQVIFEDSLDLLSGKNASWAVYLKFFGLDGPETTCDIFVCDTQSGQLSAVILDVTFSKLQVESLRQALGGSLTVAAPQSNKRATLIPPQPSRPVAIATPQPTRHITITAPASNASSTIPSPQFTPRRHSISSEEVIEDIEPVTTRPQTPDSSVDNESILSPDLPDVSKLLFELLGRIADVDVGSLRSDMSIFDLGIDSLMGMEVADEISKVFSIKIGVREFESAHNVGALCKLIADRTSGFSYNSDVSSRSPSDVPDTTGSKNTTLTSATSSMKLSGHEDPRPTKELSTAAHKAFDLIREEFDVIAQETGCDKFCSEIHPSQASLIVAYITEAFAKLGCDLSAINAGQKIPDIPHLPRNEKLMAQLMRALRDDGLLTQVHNDWVRTSKAVALQPTSSERYDRIIAEFPQFAPEHKLLHVVGSKLDECLSGELDPLVLLFGSPEKRKLMADQYLIAPIQASVSQQLVSFIKTCFGSQTLRQTVRVLEIGGGTCGTTLPAVNAFAQLGISVEYTFTDISSSFITAAKSKLREHTFVKFRTLDITQDPSADIKGYFDMIIATNVMHATPDVCKSSSNARQLLRPGGFLTLVEYTWRNYYLLDVIFGQLDGWWLFNDGRDHATMDVSDWKKTLLRAGFGEVDWTEGQTEESKICRIILAY